MRRIIGLDIGGTKCAALLAEVGNGIRIVDREVFPTRTELGFTQAWDRLTGAVEELLRRSGVALTEVTAMGVSCGNPMDAARGVILSPPNLPGWDNVEITRMLKERFGVPAFLQNDANACALVEWMIGAGRGCSNMIFLTMGTGMGAGIIAEGRLLSGACGNAGEVGHTRLAPDGPVGYGKAGSFEGFCSGGGIERLAERMTSEFIAAGSTPAWARKGERLTVKALADHARAGNGQAKEVLSVVSRWLGQAVSALIDTLNPERIVIGSIFARCEDLLRPEMEAVIEAEALPDSRAACLILPAATGESLGDYASVVAACHALNIDPLAPLGEMPPEVESHFDALFARYPDLVPLKADVRAAYGLIEDCYSRQGKLLLCGNGGSAADSEHIVGELMKGFVKPRRLTKRESESIDSAFAGHFEGASRYLQRGLPAIALTQHAALSTAFLNDVAPGMVFAQQVYVYGQQSDILVAISTSGNSGNVVNAALTAKAKGMKVLSLTGPGGGKLREISDVCITAPGVSTAEIQERHLPLYHALCAMIEARFF